MLQTTAQLAGWQQVKQFGVGRMCATSAKNLSLHTDGTAYVYSAVKGQAWRITHMSLLPSVVISTTVCFYFGFD
jgi:hypothetical protein